MKEFKCKRCDHDVFRYTYKIKIDELGITDNKHSAICVKCGKEHFRDDVK